MNAEAILTVSATVVGLTEVIKFFGLVPDRFGLLVVLLLSGLGTWLWGYSQPAPFSPTQAFSYFAGWATVVMTAAGAYGFVKAVRVEDTTAFSKRLPAILLPFLIAAGLLAPACASSGNFFLQASRADLALARTTADLQLAAEAASQRDCNFEIEGLQPCISPEDKKEWDAGVVKVADAGLELTTAIEQGSRGGVTNAAHAVLGLFDGLVQRQVFKLPPNERVIVEAAIAAARTTFLILLPAR